MESTAEIKRLQSCINDLISVLALPAIWSGSESSQILGTLLDVLLTMLRLDFAYAWLGDASDGPPIEVVRLGDHRHSAVQPRQVGQALDRWLTGDQTASRNVIPDPAGEGEVSVASFSLGLQHEGGVLVAGSRRADFPTEVERLLLRVAANQAGIGLQEARRSGEQKRIAEMLEQRVAERTRRLTTVNTELRRSEAYLEEAQRLSRTGSFGWRVSTGEIFWSEETFRIFQYDRTTKPTVELILRRVHPEDAAFVRQTIERASQDGKDFDFEYRLLMTDGSVKHVHVVAHALSDESGGIEFVGAVMDATESKRAEAELRESEEQWRDVFENNPTMYFMVDAAGTVMAVNPFGAEQLGYRIDELAGQPVLGVFPESERDMVARNVAACLEQMGRSKSWEARKVRKDGTEICVRETAKAVPRVNGPIVLIACEDITEQKRAAEALREAQADLARVSRVTTMGELTASLAHEVNQPITAAVTNAKTCVRWLAADAPNIEEAREAALRSANNGTRAAEIISRIRLLFQKGTPQRELVDINEVIREIIVLLRGEATRYSISMKTKLGAELPSLMADRVQMQQVFMNLVLNGIEAMKDVDDERELFIKSQFAEDEQLLISISDTGGGLPPQADRIFDAFFTTKLHGTGMGLSISRSIVESHGGRLWADGNSPRGATFHIALPTKVEAH
jgi:PAS domain S-box-containing protein